MRNLSMLACAALVTGVALSLATPAAAQVTPGFLSGAYGSTSSTQCVNSSTDRSAGATGCSVTGAQVQVLGAPYPKVLAQVDDEGLATTIFTSGDLSYFFMVLGTPDAANLGYAHVGLTLHLDSDAQDGSASATFASDYFGSRTVCTTPAFCASSSLTQTFLQLVPLNHPIEIQLEATAGGNDIFGEASGLADPFVFIDPSDPNGGGFQLIFSEGIVNALPGAGGTDAVPEPAVWALMLAGLGLAGVKLRRPALSAV